MLLPCWILLYLFSDVETKRPKSDHSLLTTELLSDYGATTARPVLDAHTIINVSIDFQIQRVIELNERGQTLKISAFLELFWHDEHLRWNTTEHPHVDDLIIPTDQIWRPDIHLHENVDRNFESFKDVGASVFPDGTVEWLTPGILHTACRIDARKFPFDTQHCTLRFASWVYNKQHLNLQPIMFTSPGRFFIENGIWEFKDLLVDHFEETFGEGRVFQEVLYTVVLERRPLFHVFTFILPCALLSLLNLMAFLLPTESGEKVSLGITNLLALVLFQQLIADSLPPSSVNMPIISYYFAPMILIGCLSIVSGVSVAYLYHHKTGPVPRWLRKVLCLRSSASSRLSLRNNESSIKYSDAQYVSDNGFTLKNMDADQSDNEAQVSNGHKAASIAYPSRAGGKAPLERHMSVMSVQVSPERAEWRQVATAIDHFLLAVGILITLTAVSVTGFLFVSVEEI